jgi:hypothetical protein
MRWFSCAESLMRFVLGRKNSGLLCEMTYFGNLTALFFSIRDACNQNCSRKCFGARAVGAGASLISVIATLYQINVLPAIKDGLFNYAS